jgi:hypothetical protein
MTMTDTEDFDYDVDDHFSDYEIGLLEFVKPVRRTRLKDGEKEDTDNFMVALMLSAAHIAAVHCPSKACRRAEICTRAPLACLRCPIARDYAWNGLPGAQPRVKED